MTKITNTARGARGVHTTQGLVMVEPGQSVDVELADNEDDLYEGLVKSGAAKKAAPDEPKALSAMNKAELIEAAQADGVTIALDADGKDVPIAEATNKQIAAAVEKARAAKQ